MAFGIQRRVGEITQKAEAVIDRDDNRRTCRTPFGEPSCVVVVTLAVEQSAAVNPDQDWILPSPRVYREDIEIEAILRVTRRPREHPEFVILRASVAECC
jgi:hypothetical protein